MDNLAEKVKVIVVEDQAMPEQLQMLQTLADFQSILTQRMLLRLRRKYIMPERRTMMKKLLMMVLTTGMIFTLTACGSSTAQEPAEAPIQGKVKSEEAKTEVAEIEV